MEKAQMAKSTNGKKHIWSTNGKLFKLEMNLSKSSTKIGKHKN